MKAGESIVIDRVGNGWVVRPYSERFEPIQSADVVVFTRMGWATTDGNECLLGFVEGHFAKEEAKP